MEEAAKVLRRSRVDRIRKKVYRGSDTDQDRLDYTALTDKDTDLIEKETATQKIQRTEKERNRYKEDG
jgi:hypothetical protein